MYWLELVEKLKIPSRSSETLVQYLRLPKPEQDDLKDVGGFVGGVLKGNRRKADNITGRDIVTLDMDNIPPGGTQEILRRLESLNCGYATYSTRKHEEAKPRLRILFPLNRTATTDEYEPLARKIATYIGIEFCDPSTFQVHRLMYWPSCCSDSQYVYQFGDKPFLSVDGVLGQYVDWRNMSEWPQVPGKQIDHKRLIDRQGDPTTKKGVVGAFCRVYDVYKAMSELIPGVYEPCTDGSGDVSRYTYTGGSTTGGALVYEDGKFLYSHHATDPAGDKLCNVFDLVRLHKFGDLDEEAKPDTPAHKLPSYLAMCEFALSDSGVSTLLNQERYEKAAEAFSDGLEVDASEGFEWMKLLEVSPTTGKPEKSTKNVRLILEHDPLIKGRIKKDTFADRIIGFAPLPWRKDEKGTFAWKDEDDRNFREYIEVILGFRSRELIEDALYNHAMAHGFNPVKTYLDGLQWDGVSRLDTLLIDYLGAEDCDYTRTVTRKSLVAAVARVMEPGCKFDNMTVISGRQGIYKSTLLAKLGGSWFSDSLRTFEGKEAAELLQGVWILEIAELAAYGKTDIRIIKQFLSKSKDHYRAAYARKTEEHPRKCIFFGTTNDQTYLNDPTGNRRFWPVEAEVQLPTKSVPLHLDKEKDQIWAEAVLRWRLGETLYLSKEMEEEADKRRANHTDRDPLQGQIEEFLDKPIPVDWDKWSLNRRLLFWSNGIVDVTKLTSRSKVCAAEIWQECLGAKHLISKADSNRIFAILSNIEGWEKVSTARFGGGHGRQKGFKRVNQPLKNVNQVPDLSTVGNKWMSTMSIIKNETVDTLVDT